MRAPAVPAKPLEGILYFAWKRHGRRSVFKHDQAKAFTSGCGRDRWQQLTEQSA